MAKTILFSPVGGTDPISNNRDGAFLHIARVYKPDIVYLYMSKEMLEFQRIDNEVYPNEGSRYDYCIKKLSEKLNKKIEINHIDKANLVDVQKFDTFYTEFREIIKNILKKYPDAKLLLNVSSGTPGMKSAIQVLSTLEEFKFTPIQVATPIGRINPNREDKKDYNVKLKWACNEDNDDTRFVNRCEESKTYNLLAEIKKNIMKKHICAYDYVAALDVANSDDMQDKLSDYTIRLLQAAKERLALNIDEVKSNLNGLPYDILPIKDKNLMILFEYYMSIVIKVKKKEYGDFIRAITPLLDDVFEMIVVNSLKIDLDKCTIVKEVNGHLVRKWSNELLQTNCEKIWSIFENAYKSRSGGFRDETNVSYYSLTTIVEKMSDDKRLVESAKVLRRTQSHVRNLVAHEIISVTTEKIFDLVKKTPEEILEILKNVMVYAGIDMSEEVLETYDNMNKFIIETME